VFKEIGCFFFSLFFGLAMWILALAAKNVKGALSAVDPLKKGCLYMMYRPSSMKMYRYLTDHPACDFR